MKTELTINLRVFPVIVKDQRTGEVKHDTVVLAKEQLRAAQIVGQSSKELIYRIFNRAGYTVLEIGKTEKREISMDLQELHKLHSMACADKREQVGA